MNRDLTTGNPGRALMGFCLPLFGSIIFQQLYNIADSFVAGKFISDKALAAVGNSYEITLIFIAFAFGCNIGCSVIAAQLFGARRYSELKTAVYSSLIATAVLCAVLMAVGMIFCSDILDLMNTDPSVKADSELYLDIYTYSGFRLCSFITSPRESSRLWATQKRLLSFLPYPQPQTYSWIYGL